MPELILGVNVLFSSAAWNGAERLFASKRLRQGPGCLSKRGHPFLSEPVQMGLHPLKRIGQAACAKVPRRVAHRSQPSLCRTTPVA